MIWKVSISDKLSEIILEAWMANVYNYIPFTNQWKHLTCPISVHELYLNVTAMRESQNWGQSDIFIISVIGKLRSKVSPMDITIIIHTLYHNRIKNNRNQHSFQMHCVMSWEVGHFIWIHPLLSRLGFSASKKSLSFILVWAFLLR